MNKGTIHKRHQKRFNIPVIGHFANMSIRFDSILQAEHYTGISYTLIYEACVGKVYKARNVYWEFENGAHYIKYKAFYIRTKRLLQDENEHEQGHAHVHGHKKINKKKELAKH